jgi:hypothetical protein
MDNNKFIQKIIIIQLVFFISIGNLTAQENKLFKEYISCFTEKYFTDIFQNCDTIGNKPYMPIKSTYFIFLDKDMQDSTMITWIVCKKDKYYLTLLSQQIDTSFLLYYYYFVFYDEIGNIVNSYKFLASSENEHDTKLFINKYSIKYLLYGPYVEKEETNCKEVIYEITNKGSLKQVSEQNYEVKRKNLFTW